VTIYRIPGYSYSSDDRESFVAAAIESKSNIQNDNHSMDDRRVNTIEPNEEGTVTSINTNPDNIDSQPQSQNLKDTSSEQDSRANSQQKDYKPINPGANGFTTGSSNDGSVPTNGQAINNAPNNENSVVDISSPDPEDISTGGTINIQSGAFKYNILRNDGIKLESLIVNDNKFDLTVRDESSSSGSKQIELWRKYEDANWQEVRGNTLDGQNKTRFSDHPTVPGNYTYQLRGGSSIGK
jgi:hypothetical protein